MQIKDFEDLISNLNMVDVSLKQNLQKLEKIDIEKQLSNIAVENIGRNLTKEFEIQIKASTEVLGEHHKTLIHRISSFQKATEGLMQIDSIADDIQTIVQQNKKMEKRYMLIPVAVTAVTVAIFTFFASNVNNYFNEAISGENSFVERFPDSKFIIGKNRNIIYLTVPANTEISRVNGSDNIFIGFSK